MIPTISIDRALEQLKQYREKHFELGKAVIRADGGAFYKADILVISTLNRSVCLLKGFVALIEEKNFVAAAPLIRVQLDNCLRLSAGTLVKDTHKFAMNILEGIPVRKQRDRSKKLMTDQYLVNKLAQQYTWIKKVYDNTSGYIHFSEKHIVNAMKMPGEDGKFTMKVTDKDEFVPDEIYIEAIEAFKAITDIFFEYVSGWAYTKDNPIKAAKELRMRFQVDDKCKKQHNTKASSQKSKRR
jgi:hypothetical protein